MLSRRRGDGVIDRVTRRRFSGALRAGGVALAVALALALAGGATGCRSKAKSPEEAYRRFAAAVGAGDGTALFDALDLRTRWAWMTVQKSHREAYDIILSSYPEGPGRDRELRRFEHGATLGSARKLFAEDAEERQVRAIHDGELVRTNAADYERAAARNASR